MLIGYRKPLKPNYAVLKADTTESSWLLDKDCGDLTNNVLRRRRRNIGYMKNVTCGVFLRKQQQQQWAGKHSPEASKILQ